MIRMRAAVFLDRDGVINEHIGYLVRWDQFKLIDGSIEAIKLLNKKFLIVIVTNQPQIARGFCSEKDIQEINNRMKQTLSEEGARLDAIYYCPHSPSRGMPKENKKYIIDCDCRKPKTGMVSEAVKDLDIDVKRSFFIGDSTRDILTGKNAGCTTILVKTGNAGKDGTYDVKPDFVCENLLEAAKLILSKTKSQQ
jgi:D,D-heptose 1,7-bisphosphate phosphatase